MGKRAHAVAEMLVDEYDGVASAVWTTAADGSELYRRLRALPGYGEEKAKIFVALLAKRLGIRPDGWREAAGVFADDAPRSAADVGSAAEAHAGAPVEAGAETEGQDQAGVGAKRALRPASGRPWPAR